MRHLLDTNIIIHVLRGNPMYAHLLEMLLDADHVLASCPITITEIYAGMRPIEEPRTRAFMESLSFLPITPRAAELAGLGVMGRKLKLSMKARVLGSSIGLIPA